MKRKAVKAKMTVTRNPKTAKKSVVTPPPNPAKVMRIRADDNHWPWPLHPHEISGPHWKINWRWKRRVELYNHFNCTYPDHHIPNIFPDITYP
jgi:hypothetical protein